MDERLLFWIRFAVGLLACWVALVVCQKIGGAVEALMGVGTQGYGASTSDALWSALRESVEAIAAIGFAVLVVSANIIRSLLVRWLQWPSPEPNPGPQPGPRPNRKLVRLLDLLKRLKM